MNINEFSIACKLVNLKLRGFEIPKQLPPTMIASLTAYGSTPILTPTGSLSPVTNVPSGMNNLMSYSSNRIVYYILIDKFMFILFSCSSPTASFATTITAATATNTSFKYWICFTTDSRYSTKYWHWVNSIKS